MDLFDTLKENNKQIPLAEILRPKTLEEYLGQYSVTGVNSPLVSLLKTGRLFSLILWGPPGCGKTTLARIISNYTNSCFIELSAVSSGIKEIKDAVETAKEKLIYGTKTILFIDEIHRYNKTQQDALLPHIENGTVFLIGSTTENPSFQVNSALLSRLQVIRLSYIDDDSMRKIIKKGFQYLSEQYCEVSTEKEAEDYIINYARGDARSALNLIENVYFSAPLKEGARIVTVELTEQLAQTSSIRYSRQEHYDMASAFQKSMRGSDADAAIYWLAKMLTAGEDPRFIARRMIVCAAEDVSNADPNALTIALNAFKAAEILGMPESRIPLAQAVEYIARAPKSNKAVIAVDEAISDINSGLNFQPPMHLRDSHYKDAKKYGFGTGYVYTHDN
ncbi:MAG: replication-associated recombination protein A, partial [Candidatus Gastranaerophilales bacterium]|nr:replication-associated recombination protein A [Candidatus Gastranaerophilales bacterium]